MLMTQCSLKNYFIKSITIFLFIFILSPFTTKAQAVYQPYSYQFYQKLNSIQYSTETRQHTALKPFLIDSVMRPSYDSLMNLNFQERDSWLGRKIYNEH